MIQEPENEGAPAPGTPGAPGTSVGIVPAPPAATAPRPSEAPKTIDRWAHRRAEPRPLAFMWTMFLAVSSALTLAALVAQGATGHDVYRPAARGLFVIVSAGLAILWPMLRLSQEVPRESITGAVAKDLTVLVAPVQAVLWPQALFFLADWPAPVVGACAALQAAWALLIGAVLAAALEHAGAIERARGAGRAGVARAAWMGSIVAIVTIGPLASIGAATSAADAGSTAYVNVPAMASPLTGVLELTSDRSWSGRPAAVLPAHWRAVGFTALGALGAWTLGLPLRRRFRALAPTPAVGPADPPGIKPLGENLAPNSVEGSPGPGSPGAGGSPPPDGS